MNNLYLIGDKSKKRRFKKYQSFVSLDGAVIARKNKVMPKAFVVADSLSSAIYRFLLQVNFFDHCKLDAKTIKRYYDNELFGISEKTIKNALREVELVK